MVSAVHESLSLCGPEGPKIAAPASFGIFLGEYKRDGRTRVTYKSEHAVSPALTRNP
jgi:hypothetical protein